MCSLWWLVALWRWPPAPAASPPPPHHHHHPPALTPSLPPERRSSSWPRPPFVAADSRCALGSASTSPSFTPLTVPALTQIWRVRGCEGLDDGDVGEVGGFRGLYLGNDDLFVCTWAPSPCPSPCFPSSSSSCPGASPPPTLRHPAHSPVGTRPLVGWPRAVAVTLALAVKGGGPNLPQRRRINLGFFLTSVLAAWSSRSKELLTHKKLLFVFFFINSIYIGTKCVVLFNTPLILQYLITL